MAGTTDNSSSYLSFVSELSLLGVIRRKSMHKSWSPKMITTRFSSTKHFEPKVVSLIVKSRRRIRLKFLTPNLTKRNTKIIRKIKKCSLNEYSTFLINQSHSENKRIVLTKSYKC